jgi:hypothetical protein
MNTETTKPSTDTDSTDTDIDFTFDFFCRLEIQLIPKLPDGLLLADRVRSIDAAAGKMDEIVLDSLRELCPDINTTQYKCESQVISPAKPQESGLFSPRLFPAFSGINQDFLDSLSFRVLIEKFLIRLSDKKHDDANDALAEHFQKLEEKLKPLAEALFIAVSGDFVNREPDIFWSHDYRTEDGSGTEKPATLLLTEQQSTEQPLEKQ